ncbi:MAG TPA: GGDEF domain-containing protein [Gammaproteobacteria bacterium]|nr:GGDEF domain-containing protein [Gammaproteobacteria bacterium]
MPPDQVIKLIATIGLASQGAAGLLLALLFFLLRPYAVGRRYFLKWANAWVLIAAAVGVLVWSEAAPVPTANFLYQLGKLTAFALLFCGTLEYARSIGHRLVLPMVAAAAVWAAITFRLDPSLVGLMMWQAPAVILMSLGGAWLLLNVKPPRRNIGVIISGGMFILIAVTWTLYLIALLDDPATPAPDSIAWLAFRYDAWLDLILDVLLAFGMVLILLDDVRREAEAAHDELNAAHAQLQEEAMRDSLTRVLNRRAFNEGVGLNSDGGGAVLVCDLDDLKEVNDNYGHKSGDKLLKYFVSIVQPRLRSGDKLYRFGGDEFLMVLPHADAADALTRIESVLAKAPPLRLTDVDASLGLNVSVGASAYDGPMSLHEAVVRADNAMYECKRQRKLEFGVRELSAPDY